MAYVEFDEPRPKPVVMTSNYLSTLTQHILKLCAQLCNNQPYICTSVLFRL